MKCIKCDCEMFTAIMAGAAGTPIYLTNKTKNIFDPEKRCNLEVWVCPVCGYTELKAVSPDDLIVH